ncbi:MAG: hypothetical protein IPM42_18910 [Saprospiraceae bacterium]|nr:hypothetical protein [Saprospiraceae bacterium]
MTVFRLLILRKILLLVFTCFISEIYFSSVNAQITEHYKKVVFQAFWWDYKNDNYPDGWSNYLMDLAPRLKSMGVDAVWIPPSIKNQNFGEKGVGYAPYDHYDLGDKFQKGDVKTRLGTKDELLRMIAVMHANGIEVIQDVVPNHIIGAGSDNGSGGQDPGAPVAACTDNYKNFRFSSWLTPAGDQSFTDYVNRKGRWPKNHHNFHPNNDHNCNLCSPSGDAWCWQGFGPDVCYYDGAHGNSSNAVYNPDQTTYSPYNNGGIGSSNGYMRKHTREWLIWYKKQTGFDGLRIDAVKHFPEFVCRDFLINLQNNAQWANGGPAMFSVGEWVGETGTLDAWTNAVLRRSGTFDFNLRAFDMSGGLRGMIYGDGGFNLGSLPSAQQNLRYIDTLGLRIHRTVPFVNNHDTYRPQTNGVGNIIGWNSNDELSPHVDPREPRLAAAYAIMFAMDGNPQPFFEDVFNIVNTGKRWIHLPGNTTDLPIHSDLTNIIKAHGALNFKEGSYKVRSSEAGHYNTLTMNTNSSDHIIIERSGKAIIAATDSWNTDQESWVDSDFVPGTVMVDYSGGILTTSVVQNNRRVNIKTRAVGYPNFQYQDNYSNPGQHYHGYSIWAPQGIDFDNFSNSPIPTTQEWEMADDLGDSHCSSLTQGGMLPENSYSYRIVGKIFAGTGTIVNYEFFEDPLVPGIDNCIEFYDLSGNKVYCNCADSNFSGNFTNNTTRWLTIKIRHNPGNGCDDNFICGSIYTGLVSAQKAFIKVTYHAPSDANSNTYPANLAENVPFWTGAAHDNNYDNPKNWEKCTIPVYTEGKRVLFVNQLANGKNNGNDWANALTSLAEAFDKATFCENLQEIWVAEGIYLPNNVNDRLESFKIPEGLKIYGGFPSAGNPSFVDRDIQDYLTIMSADIGEIFDHSDNVYHVAKLESGTELTLLDGFEIKYGYADGVAPFNKAGGVLNQGNLQLHNITISDCFSINGASAILNMGSQAVLEIKNCSIQDNNSTLESTVENLNGATLKVVENSLIRQD